MEIRLSPIGWVRSGEAGKREDFWGDIVSEIVLNSDTFSADALAGLHEFSQS
jgi:tRNA (Thr-GGU) A37 N-methylase